MKYFNAPIRHTLFIILHPLNPVFIGVFFLLLAYILDIPIVLLVEEGVFIERIMIFVGYIIYSALFIWIAFHADRVKRQHIRDMRKRQRNNVR